MPHPSLLAPVRHFARGRFALATNVRENLRASTADGVCYGGMVGIGETYLAAFALAIGMGEVTAGLVATLPMVAGGAMQLVSIAAVRRIGSEKAWILAGATIQALTFVPLILASVTGGLSPAALILIGAVYWGAGLATGPAWNTWIESVVPAGVRTGFFATRSKFAQFATLIGFLGGGLCLSFAAATGRTMTGFAIIFATAGGLRLASVYWLWRHHPVTRPLRAARHFPSVEADQTSATAAAMHGGRLLIFMVVLQGMVQIAGPYFTPYMLRELGFSYAEFVALIAISFVAKAVSFSAWAKVSKRSGSRRLLWVGAIGLTPLSALWIVSQQFAWLVLAQIVSGIFWAAYELGFFLTFFEVLPKGQRTRMLTVYNFANTVAIAIGAILGGLLLHRLGVSETSYWILFGLSSAGRVASLGILLSASFASVPVIRLGVRVLSLRGGAATLDAPVLPSLEEVDQLAASLDADPTSEAVAGDGSGDHRSGIPPQGSDPGENAPEGSDSAGTESGDADGTEPERVADD